MELLCMMSEFDVRCMMEEGRWGFRVPNLTNFLKRGRIVRACRNTQIRARPLPHGSYFSSHRKHRNSEVVLEHCEFAGKESKLVRCKFNP